MSSRKHLLAVATIADAFTDSDVTRGELAAALSVLTTYSAACHVAYERLVKDSAHDQHGNPTDYYGDQHQAALDASQRGEDADALVRQLAELHAVTDDDVMMRNATMLDCAVDAIGEDK